MSILTDLVRLLDANDRCQTTECRECSESECPCDVLRDVLFPAGGSTDTLRALVSVAEAADIFCACERGGEPISRMSMEIALAPLFPEATCPTCNGHGGGGGFDRNGSDREISSPLCERCDYGPKYGHDDECRGNYDPDEPCRIAEPDEYREATDE